ncbi:hypothetical protein J4E90_007258 [Alternaria incomplexa]|uniref:uncharacterized protein n=1 Tax=Alternaria incomplexa TaxID=1187928 RepID=UPI00221E8EF3|nr:uncharacterized protein J4E90_007258 [Alternaria incomplexa]KAI4911001.1 hypothetical protein J4E90_007258 [Alternaria incomplexa]
MAGTDIEKKLQRVSLNQKERADEVTQFVGKLANQMEELDRMVAQGLLDIKSENIYVSLDDIGPLDSFEEWTMKLNDQSSAAPEDTTALFHMIVPPARKARAASVLLQQAITELEELPKETDSILKNEELEITQRYETLVAVDDWYGGMLIQAAELYLEPEERTISAFIDAYKEQGKDLDQDTLQEFDDQSPEQKIQMMLDHRVATFATTADNREISTFRKNILMLLMFTQSRWKSEMEDCLKELRGVLPLTETI